MRTQLASAAPGARGWLVAGLLALLAAAGCQDKGGGPETGSPRPDTQDSPGADSRDSDTGSATGQDSDSGLDTDSGVETGGETGGEIGDSGDAGGEFAPETSVTDAMTRIISDETGTDLARVLQVGDIDGDGQLDVVAGAFLANRRVGGAYAVPGPLTTSGKVQELGHHLAGPAPEGGAGRSVSIGDVDDDGYADIGVGAPYLGAGNGVYVAFGPRTDDLSLGDASVALLEGPDNTYAGHGSDISGDLNGDGIDDAVVGAYYTSSTQGLSYVVYGPVSGDIDLDREADARLEGEAAAVYAGRSVRAGADLDGDGVGDLVIAALGTLGLPASGGFYVVMGPVGGDIDLADADGRYAGESISANAGLWLATGDVGGDGLADVAATALDSTLAVSGGAAYVVYGPASSEFELGGAEIVVHGDVDGQYGGGVAMGDLDGDDVAELLLGVQGDSTKGPNAGALWLFTDPAPGTYVFSDGDAVFTAEGPSDNLGAGVAVGDVDGDRIAEIIIGAPYQDSGGSTAGAFYVMHAL